MRYFLLICIIVLLGYCAHKRIPLVDITKDNYIMTGKIDGKAVEQKLKDNKFLLIAAILISFVVIATIGNTNGDTETNTVTVATPAVQQLEKQEPQQNTNTNTLEVKIGENIGNTEDSKIDINRATKEDLMAIHGIGEVKSQRVLDEIAQNGKFIDMQDLKQRLGNSLAKLLDPYFEVKKP